MGVYQRDGSNILCYDFFDAQGTRRQISSRPKDGSHPGFRIGQEKDAEKALAIILRAIEAERELASSLSQEQVDVVLPTKGATVGMYARHWLKQREKYKPQAAKEDKWKLVRILAALEHHVLADFSARHARNFVLELKILKDPKTGKPLLAPRTVRSIWSCLHNMMDDATADGFFQSNPCVLKDGDLPSIVDKDPLWRKTAVFSRAERDQLIFDERIPLFRRVRNGILFLAGLRPSEAFALRLLHYDRTTEHLGQLDLMCAFNTARKEEKELKVAAKRRLVPVHPALSKLLAEWLLSGWEAHVGRRPTQEDLLIPNPKGAHVRVDDAYDEMLDDQTMLGWRKRRLYDSRRTFISLALADKFNRELLRWVTHGPKASEVMDLYTSIPWEEICVETLKLKVVPHVSGRIVELRRTSDGDVCDSLCDSGQAITDNVLNFQSRHPDLNRGPTDYEGVFANGRARAVAENRSHLAALSDRVLPYPTPPTGPPVTLSQGGPPPLRDSLTLALRDVLRQWEAAGDAAALKRDLLSILGALPEGGRP